ncbi:MAG: ankyrin repeat domain-containing protein [Blastocatellia bacterium]
MKNIKVFLSIVIILSIFCNTLALTPNSYIQEEVECAETGKSEQEKNDDLLSEAVINNDINTLNRIFASKIFSAKGKNEAFFLALMMGNVEAVKLLIDNGINVNMDFNKAGVGNGNPFFASTPVMAAVALGHSEILSILIKKGAKVNIKNEDGYSPMDMLVLTKYYSPSAYKVILSSLTKAGATFSKKKNRLEEKFQNLAKIDDASDKTEALLETTGNNFYSINTVKNLIAAGADVNAKDVSSRTPLINCLVEFSGSDDYFFVFSALYGCRNIVKLLIDSGADVNQQDDEGKTALIYAITIFDDLGYIPIIKDLLNAGADINLKDKDEKSALDYASESESPYIRELFGLSAKSNETEDCE